MTATAAGLASLYEKAAEQLVRREGYYPRHEEPEWSRLWATLEAIAARLWERAASEPARRPPDDLTALGDRPVFILGYYKSGTTLLLDLLDGHPELIALPGESWYFDRLAAASASDREAWLRKLHARSIWNTITPNGLPPRWLLGLPTADSDPYDQVGRLLVAFARSQPERDPLAAVAQALAVITGATPRLWVEKTPTHEFYVDRILSTYPGARFLHVVRDPRSNMTSIANFGAAVVDPSTGAAELARSFRAALAGRSRFGTRYTIVRYEDMVTDTEAVMRSIADALDIAYDDRLLIPTSLGGPATANAGRPERRVAGAVHSLSVDRISGLRRRDRLVLEALAGRPGRELGYDMAAGSRVIALMARTALFARYRIAPALRGSDRS